MEPINLGTGREILIRDLVQRVADVCDYTGRIEWDSSKPDGQPRRCLDTSLAQARLGWCAKVTLEQGLARTVAWWRQCEESNGDAAIPWGSRGLGSRD